MATITTLATADNGATSRTTINDNFTNLNTDKIETSVLSTDGTLAGDSDTEIPSEKAVKTYVDGFATSSTAGVSAGSAASSTQTITHGLGKAPSIIRLTSIGALSASGAGITQSHSTGTYNTSGNRCVYIASSSSGVVNPATSAVYSVYLQIGGAGGTATGVVGNVTATDFDIVWTLSGATVASGQFIWEAQ